MRRLWIWLVFVLGNTAGLASDVIPALEWVKSVNGLGSTQAVAARSDGQGNLYIVGTTNSVVLPVKGAGSNSTANAPLVRIETTTGQARKLYPAGLPALNCVAAGSPGSGQMFAGADDSVYGSSDAGASWEKLGQIPGAVVNGLTVDASDPRVLYAATSPLGYWKSTDGGRNWSAINTGIAAEAGGSISGYRLFVHPQKPAVLFAPTNRGLLRSANGGASWSLVSTALAGFAAGLVFDPFHTGVVYLGLQAQVLRSVDDGQTFEVIAFVPDQARVNDMLADPLRANVLYLSSYAGIYRSVDAGRTWARQTQLPVRLLAADPKQAVLYASGVDEGIVRSLDGYATTTALGPPTPSPQQLLLADNRLFSVPRVSTDAYAVKLDAGGNVVYATYIGGSANDTAEAMALGADGSLYLGGTSESSDLPVTAGTYAPVKPTRSGVVANFLAKLGPDGALVWSTFFAPGGMKIQALETDETGNVFLAGVTGGNLPTTPGVYQREFTQTFGCTGLIGCFPGPTSAFASKMDSQGKALIYSTYLPQDPAGRTWTAVTAMTVDKAGNAWLGGPSFVARLDPYGATIPASTFQQNLSIAALVLDAESNLYATGSVGLNNVNSPALVFPATPGVFQPLPKPLAPLPAGQFMPGGGSDAFVIRWDKTLQTIQAATLLGGEGADAGESIALDGEGNVLVSGRTDSLGFPTRLPFQTSFAPRTGFLAALDAKLTTLRFSTYLGNRTPFEARAATLDAQGGILLAGSTLNSNGSFIGGQNGAQFTNGGEIYANRLSLGAATEVQLDTVVNAASRLAAPLAPGEPIVLAGAGFGADARVLLDGEEVKPISGSANQLVAIVPEGAKTSGEFRIQVSTGGKVSNTVLVPATVASPGIYTTDGSGFGQGYILNRDGALNSAENPAAPGEAITIYAAGVGRYSTKDGYTVTDLPPSVYVGGFYANGIAAVTEPVEGLPGKVYKLSVFVPSYEQLVAGNPDLKSFRFPPQVAIRLVMGTVNGLNWANSNGISQPGIVLNLK